MAEYTRGGVYVRTGFDATVVGFTEGTGIAVLSEVRNDDPEYEQKVRALIRQAKTKRTQVNERDAVRTQREGRIGVLMDAENLPPPEEPAGRG